MKFKSKLKFVLALFLASRLLVSCKVSKDTSGVVDPLPAAFRDIRPDTSNISKIPWSRFFKEEDLKGLITKALKNNNDLQIAIKNIDAADLILRQAKWKNVPVVGIQVTGSTSMPSDNSLNGLTLGQFLHKNHIEDYTAGASLSWEADIWGKIRSEKAAALSSYLQTQEAKKAVQTRIVAELAKGYYHLLILDTQLEIARNNQKLNDSTLSIVKLKYQFGYVTSLAVQQAQAQTDLSAGLIPQFEQGIAIQENAIRILTGDYPGAILHGTRLSDLEISNELAVGIPAQLLNNRPDVRSAAYALDQENANVGYARANLYPSLTITAQGGLNSLKTSNWFNLPASLFGVVSAGLTQPLLAHKRLKTQFELSKVRRDQTAISFRQSFLLAVGDVSDQLVRLEKLGQQQTFSIDRVKNLQQALQNAQLLFLKGSASYLEVISAQSNALQSELELSSLKKELLDARVDLYRAVGGGWE